MGTDAFHPLASVNSRAEKHQIKSFFCFRKFTSALLLRYTLIRAGVAPDPRTPITSTGIFNAAARSEGNPALVEKRSAPISKTNVWLSPKMRMGDYLLLVSPPLTVYRAMDSSLGNVFPELFWAAL